MTSFNDTFLKACRREKTSHFPAWIMRQAGRYQPEYRAIRKKHDLVGICKDPELCAEVTILPVKQLNVDAAILFSDITIPFESMGIDFEIRENVGPVIFNPIQNSKDIENLREIDPESSMDYVGKSIRILRNELKVPLIGFAGAPFTLASYLVEGGPSKKFIKSKSMMYNEPDMWNNLMEKLSGMIYKHIQYQVENGAQAIQIFDSWAGNLTASDYHQYIANTMRSLFDRLKTLDVPLIHFGMNTSHLLDQMKNAGGDVIGIDWRTDLYQSWKKLGFDCAVQGNLDPLALFAPDEIMKQKTYDILSTIDRPGYIFNLGHGILPETDPDKLRRLIEMVHEFEVVYEN